MEIVKGLESHVVQDVLINKSVHPVSIIFTYEYNQLKEFYEILLAIHKVLQFSLTTQIQRIIGNRGSNIRKLMNEFSVDIKVSF